MPEPLRTAVVGATKHARSYASALAGRTDVELVQETGSTEAALELAAELVVISTPPHEHVRAAEPALEAGCHVLVDKPMAQGVESAEALAALARHSTGVATYVHRCCSPAITAAKNAVAEGTVGLPRTVRSVFIPAFRYGAAGAPGEASGELGNFLVYPIDYLRFVLGLELVSIHAVAAGGGSHAIVSIELERGVVGTITLGRPQHDGADDLLELMIAGSQGVVRVDEARPSLSLTGRAARTNRLADSAVTSFHGLIDDLVDAIRGGGAPLRSLGDGVATVVAVSAALRSLASGAPEQIEPAK